MKPKPYQIVQDALVVEGYKADLSQDLATVAGAIHCADIGSPAQTFADEELGAMRAGAVSALLVVSEIIGHGRQAVGCEDLAEVAELIVRCAAAAHKRLFIDGS